jgi:hypothetical protein
MANHVARASMSKVKTSPIAAKRRARHCSTPVIRHTSYPSVSQPYPITKAVALFGTVAVR